METLDPHAPALASTVCAAGLSDGEWLLNSCVAGSNGPRPHSANCSSFLVAGQSAQCPTMQPALGSPPYPTAGTVAIAMLAAISVLWLMRAILYCGCCFRSWIPVLGSRLRPGMLLSLRDYTRGWRLSLPFFLGGLSLGLKVLALALDIWEVTRPSFDEGVSDPQLLYGTMHVRWSSVPPGAVDDGSSSYEQFCDQLRDNADPMDADAPNNLKMCRTLQAAAAMTLIACCISLLFSAITTIYGVCLLAGQTSIIKRGVLGWRLVAGAQLCGLSCWAYWLLSAHLLIIHQTPHGPASLGVSFPMMVSAWLLDVLLLITSSHAVGFTQPPFSDDDFAGRSYSFRGSVVVEQPMPYARMEDEGEEPAAVVFYDEQEEETSPSRQMPSAPEYDALDSPSAANRSSVSFASEEQSSRSEGQPASSQASVQLHPDAVHLEGQLNYH